MAAQTETDLQKRTAILLQIEEILYNDAAFVPFHWQNHSYAGKSNVQIKPIVNTMNFPYLGDLVIK
jgi:peptide/nickel transport system substrate-binding protein